MSLELFLRSFISYIFNKLFYILFKILNYLTSDENALRFCMKIFIYFPQYYFSISIQTLIRSLLKYTKPDILEYFHTNSNVPFYIISNNKNPSQDILSILYIHGDEYTSRRQFCTELYHRIQNKFPYRKIEVYIPIYRSSPEFSIDNSLNDIAIIYKHLKEKSRKLWIIADSFGGCLAVQLATELSELDCNGMILLSPITNLYHIEGKKMIQSRINNISFIPISIPIYIFVSQNELFRDDARDLYRINRHSRLYETPNTVHLFPLFWHLHEKGNYALSKMVTLIN